jgi:hypothetical protein
VAHDSHFVAGRHIFLGRSHIVLCVGKERPCLAVERDTCQCVHGKFRTVH